jgi:hypothetical protein
MHLKGISKKEYIWGFCVFSLTIPVILKYLLTGPFYHEGKFLFMKSKLNSAFFTYHMARWF